MKCWQNGKYFPVHMGLERIEMLTLAERFTIPLFQHDSTWLKNIIFFQFASFLCIYFDAAGVTELRQI